MLQRRWKLPALSRRYAELARFNMPKLAPLLFDSVFFLFRRNPKTNHIEGPCGTGVLAGRDSKDLPGETNYYGITNWHVACELGASIVRVNTRDGKSRLIEHDPSEWKFFPRSDDLAAIDLTDDIAINADEVSFLAEDMFVTPDVIREFEIAAGADAFMSGLFVSHHGGDRNVPALRFGNISMLASEDAPVEIEATGAMRPSHLVDTRSRTGFSGSPVVVYRVPGDDLTRIPMDWKRPPGQRFPVYNPKDFFVGVLGIHCAQFWENISFRKKPKRSQRVGDAIVEGDELEIQSGITIVVPAWRITDLLNLEAFELARKQRDEKRADRHARRARSEAVEIPGSDANDNPNHLEDFTRLVDVAARKRPQGDQT